MVSTMLLSEVCCNAQKDFKQKTTRYTYDNYNYSYTDCAGQSDEVIPRTA